MQPLVDKMPPSPQSEMERALQIERAAFAAKVRSTRTMLGMGQAEFARCVGLTQKSVHRIERQMVDAKLRTLLSIQRFWVEQGIVVEDLPDGGFRITVREPDRISRPIARAQLPATA